MAHLERSVVCLRIIGDALVPDEITKLLGSHPTYSQIKGETLVGKAGISRQATFGMWQMSIADSEPENLDGQIEGILAKLTNDLDVWLRIGERYDLDFFCGLFMGVNNEGLSISPRTLVAIGQRGIELDLDIYGPGE